MSILDQIFSDRAHEECRLIPEHNLDNEIYALLKKKKKYKNDEQLSDLLFEACNCGERAGFHSGVRFTIAFLLECLL